MSAPATMIEWLGQQLDAALAALPDDSARFDLLNRQANVWSQRMRRFYETDGDSEVAHPTYGLLTPGDFLIVLSMINGRKAKLERTLV